MMPASARDYRIFGVPLRSGSLYPGNENDPQAYRDAGLVGRLRQAGCRASDEGDIAIPSYLPHHLVAPIRNWPGPRIVWDCVADRIAPLLKHPECVPFLIGCDCSVAVGTTQALTRLSGPELHVVYVDGDFDDAPADPSVCRSAAAVTMWLLTTPSPFCAGPRLEPAQVTIVGCTQPSQMEQCGPRAISLAEVRRSGPEETARDVLAHISPSADIMLHLDIDVFQEAALPAAYFPHEDGLDLTEGSRLIGPLLRDPRVRVIEVTEYASLRDLDRQSMGKLIDLVVDCLGS